MPFASGSVGIGGGIYPATVSGSQGIAPFKGDPNFVFPEEFGAAGTGTLDDTQWVQAAANKAVATGRKLAFAAGKQYRITAPITIDNVANLHWPMFEVQGQVCGSAISVYQSGNVGSTILCDGCDGFVFQFWDFYNESAKVSSLSFRQIGAKGTTTAITYSFNQTSYARKQFLTDVNAVGFAVGVKFLGLSATLNDNYFGTTVLAGVHTYLCDSGVVFNNVYANLAQFRDSLFHGCIDYGVKFINGGAGGGGIVGFTGVHFEACEPAAIQTSGFNTDLAWRDTSHESCGVASGKGAWDFGPNTRLDISGNEYLPGSFEVAPVLPAFCALRTSVPIQIRATGGLVLTPDMVQLVPVVGGYCFAYFPLDAATQPRRGTQLGRFNGSGTGSGSGAPSFIAQVPAGLRDAFGFSPSVVAYDRRASHGTDPAARYLVASFVAHYTNFASLLNTALTLNGVTTAYSEANAQNASGVPLVCVLVQHVPATQDVTRLSLSARNADWVTAAYVSYEAINDALSLAALGVPSGKSYVDHATVAVAGAFTFAETGIFQAPYAVELQLVLNGGRDGLVRLHCYGILQNTLKFRDIDSASRNASILVAAADGAHEDLYNVTITNNTAAAVDVQLRVRYL